MPKPIEIPTVYCILHSGLGKRYIGSTTNYKRRKAQHLHSLRYNKHFCASLQEDYNEFGERSIEFSVLEEVKTYDRKELATREKFWIRAYNPEYNVQLTGLGTKTKKQIDAVIHVNKTRFRSEEEKSKHSEFMKTYWKSNPKVVSEGTKEKLRQINLGKNNPNWGKPRSQESKDRISKSNSKIEYALKDPNGNILVFRNALKPPKGVPPRWILKKILKGDRVSEKSKYYGWTLLSKEQP